VGMKRALLLFVVLATASGAALAHSRGRVHLGFHFGFPVYPSYWYYPPPPVYYPYPAVVAPPASPPVYVEREQENWWYYCEQTRGYYPYVKECPTGWTRVPPAPPPAQ
jgi:hypothetical protein